MSKEHLFRFDMSEYQTQESLGLLLGGKFGERAHWRWLMITQKWGRCCSMKSKRHTHACWTCSYKSWMRRV